MSQYKLTYFNLGALAEPIRWIFKIAGVEFEDERIELEDWEGLKKSGRFPTEQLPLLEIDGEVYTQSKAIARYLARKYGLDVDDDLLRLRVDQVTDILSDAGAAFRTWLLEKDPEKKETIKADLVAEKLPLFLKQIEAIVSSSEGNYITGDKLTYGDLFLAHTTFIWTSILDENLLSNYPALVKQRKAVLAIPQVDAWIQVRPKTLF